MPGTLIGGSPHSVLIHFSNKVRSQSYNAQKKIGKLLGIIIKLRVRSQSHRGKNYTENGRTFFLLYHFLHRDLSSEI